MRGSAEKLRRGKMKNVLKMIKSKLRGFRHEVFKNYYYMGVSGTLYSKDYYKVKDGYIFNNTETRILDKEASK